MYLGPSSLHGHFLVQLFQSNYLIELIKKKTNLDNVSGNGSKVCFSEVVLDYCDEFHDLHNDYIIL